MAVALYPRKALAEDLGVALEPAGFRGIALAHNVRSRAEVDRVLAKAVEAGATLLKPGADAVWGGYVGYFADPDRFAWEVAWNPSFPLDAEGRIALPA